MLHTTLDQLTGRPQGGVLPVPYMRFALKALPVAVALCFCPTLWAGINDNIAGLPMGGTVTAGAVSSDLTGNRLTLTQTGARAVIDWQSFNINAGKTVQFVQDSSTAAALNRVPAGVGMSEIYGTLTANGMVLLMNPNGVLFGGGAQINVGSLIATTGTVSQTGFMAGGSFAISGVTNTNCVANTSCVTNQGTITAANAGLVALVAPSVSNQGTITATGGRIALSGADRATVSLNGGLYEFAVDAGALGTNASLSNAAGATLNGATLFMSTGDAANLLSGVINLEGVQQASSAMVVNGNTVVLKSALQTPVASGNSNQVDVYSGAHIQEAVNIAKTGAVGSGASVNVHGGSFAEQLTLNKANLTLSGSQGARIVVPDAAQVNGISIAANNVSVSGMEIAGPVNQPYLGYAWGSNISRGIAVSNGVTGFTLSNNNIHDVRNGILIDGRNTGSVTGNRIENTKSAISVQYTDAAGITIANNTQGTTGNEWGLNLHLNGVWNPATNTINPNTDPYLQNAPTLAWQQSLLGLGTSNAGWSVQDQAYKSSNRTQVTVATAGGSGNQGSQLAPLDTIAGGVAAVVTGGVVNVAAGSYVQASTLSIGKSLTLAGAGQAASTIDARGVSGYGISVSADNVTLRDFTLYGPSANAAASYGIKVSPGGNASSRLRNFSISNVTSRGAGRAELDLNGVDGALIDHVTADGAPVGNDTGTTQGAGIQLTDSANITVRNATTRNNAWGGLALYQANRSYDQQVNNITIEGNNTFTELNPVYLQDESATRDFGALSISGFGFAVRNASTFNSSFQYTWLQPTQQSAFDLAVNVPVVASSYVQRWNGALATQDFYVGVGNLLGGGTQAMSVATTVNLAASGANIRVGPGRYAEDVVLNNPYNLYFDAATVSSLRLNAAASGTGISGTVTAQGGGGFLFNAPIRLLGDTNLNTLGADIALNGDIQNASGTTAALHLVAGTDGNRGNVSLATGGAQANALGRFEVFSNRFSLLDTLWVKSYKIDALGDVALSGHTLRGQDASGVNTMTAGGNVTGSTISVGSVQITSGGDISANVAGSDVSVSSQGNLNVTVTATNTATLQGDSVVATVAGRDVAVTSNGSLNAGVTATNTATLQGDSVVATVAAPAVAVSATHDAQISGSAPSITVDAPSGRVSGDFGKVTNAGDGLVNVNGRPQGNETLTANSENNRVMPTATSLSGNSEPAAESRLRVALAGDFPSRSGNDARLGSPATAGDFISRGQAVELDLSPGREPEKK